jgi:hypothetical protein
MSSPSAVPDRIDTMTKAKKRASAAVSCGNPLSVGLTGFEPATLTFVRGRSSP